MNVSVMKVICRDCSSEFQGYLKKLPLIGVNYSAICPSCNGNILFFNQAGWLEMSVPDGAIEVTIVV